MAALESRTPLSVRVTRTFAAPREKVFRAWTDPASIKHWFIEAAEGQWSEEPRVDPRPGGAYRLAGVSGGKPWCIHGTYLEVTPPERLVFTWLWEDHPEVGNSGDTLVTVELNERGGATELVLTHERFTTEASRQDHAMGWEGCLDAVERLLS